MRPRSLSPVEKKHLSTCVKKRTESSFNSFSSTRSIKIWRWSGGKHDTSRGGFSWNENAWQIHAGGCALFPCRRKWLTDRQPVQIGQAACRSRCAGSAHLSSAPLTATQTPSEDVRGRTAAALQPRGDRQAVLDAIRQTNEPGLPFRVSRRIASPGLTGRHRLAVW